MFNLSIITCMIIALKFVFSMQLSIMYPFGPKSGDASLPKNDDAYGPINLGAKIKFFDKSYSSFYVNTNGVISFLSPISKPYSPKKYPTSIPLISPFWSDINTEVGGQIYYRKSSSSSDLNQAKSDIANVYATTFNPSRVYITTWNQVAAYDGSSAVNNTFQVVIATDEKLSFLIFNFGSMSWPNSQFSMNSFFGYNAGNNITFYSYPYSFTNNITNVSLQSNVKIPGKWIFMVSSASTTTTSSLKTTLLTTTQSTPDFNGSLLYTIFTGHTDLIRKLTKLPNGNLVSGSDDRTIKIWNPKNGSLVLTLNCQQPYISMLEILPNGNLASGSADATIKIWNPNNGSLIFILIGKTSGIVALVTLHDGNLASGSYDGIFEIWNPSNGTLLNTFNGGSSSILSLATLLNGNLASSSWDSTVKIWNPYNGVLIFSLSPINNIVFILKSLPNGNLVTCSGDGNVKIWNPNNGLLLNNLTGNKYSVSALVTLPNNNLATGSMDGTIKIWNLNNGSLLFTLTGHTGYIESLETLINYFLVAKQKKQYRLSYSCLKTKHI
jgi:WD40 repeat protein